MKASVGLGILSAALVLVPGIAASISPDEALCDGFASASSADKATRLANFYRAVSSAAIPPPEPYLVCLAQKVPSLEPHALEYCGARAERGHGLIADKMHSLSSAIEFAIFDCAEEAERPFWSRAKSPVPCKDIEPYLRDSLALLAPVKPAEQLECMYRTVPKVAAKIRSSCGGEPIPPGVVMRLWDVLAAACPVEAE